MTKTCLSLLLGAALWHASALAAAAPPGIEALVKAEGQLAFSDGSSVFVLRKGGAFRLEPVGISGRTIVGVWRTTDYRHFAVTGKWSWVNGTSRDDDYRRMTLYVSYHPGAPRPPQLARHTAKLSSVYFTVEELVPISKAEHDKSNQKSNRRAK